MNKKTLRSVLLHPLGTHLGYGIIAGCFDIIPTLKGIAGAYAVLMGA